MQIWKNFLNLFLQSNCPLCGRATSEEFCEYCHRQLQKCRLSDSNRRKENSPPIIAWGIYGGSIKRAITTMKYDNHPEIARPLGEWLGEVWLQNYVDKNKDSLIVVPIPMHPEKQKKRGFNQAALIAKSFCQTTGLQLKLSGLQRVKQTEALFGLSPTERKETLTEAFEIGKDFRKPPNAPVILVDDIYTTGATVKSAIETLSKSGIVVSGVAAVAVTSQNNHRKKS